MNTVKVFDVVSVSSRHKGGGGRGSKEEMMGSGEQHSHDGG
jgi:hypothetical protein